VISIVRFLHGNDAEKLRAESAGGGTGEMGGLVRGILSVLVPMKAGFILVASRDVESENGFCHRHQK
jgi:hypothetical protein